MRGWAIWQRAADRDAGIASAAIALFAILGLVPALSAIGLVCGWLSGPVEVLKAFAVLCRLLPPETGQFVLKQLAQALASGGQDGAIALLTTLGFGLYGLMNAATALIDGLNLAYDLPEQRNWFARATVASAMALAGAVAVVAMIAALLIFARLHEELIPVHGVIVWLAVPCALVFATCLLAMIYRFAPSQQHGQPHRVLPGAIAAVILGMAGSAGFAIYAAHLANFTATYGLLASIAPTLLWLQLCGYVVLLGAAVNAESPAP
jgi:membrane protein